MRKRMITMISIILTIVLTLGISVPISAESGDRLQTGSLIIQRTQPGETYTLYKIFDMTWSANGNTPADKDSTEGNHAYTINEDFKKFFTDEKIGGFKGDTKDLKAGAYVDSRKDDLAEFATELEEYIIGNNIAPAKTVEGRAGTTTVEGLLYGYYLLVPADNLSADGLSALFSLDTVKPNAQVQHKSQYPAVDKVIVENGADVEANSVSIGDVINYKITSFVPNMNGYRSYIFYLTDTMDDGLSFNNDVAVWLSKDDSTKKLTKDTDFTVAQNGQVITISLLDFVAYDEIWEGADVIITYSATLNEKAIVGANGNNNGVTLTYSSNPAVLSETKTTAEDIVTTYTTGIELRKIDADGLTLNGARFQLTGEAVNKVRVYGNKFTEDTNGTHYKLIDGTFTKTEPDNETNALYESVTKKYSLQYTEEVQTKTETFSVSAYVDDNGKLIIEGLNEGTYMITELTAPNGYHLLSKPVTLNVSCTVPNEITDGTEKCIWTVEMTNPNDEKAVPSVTGGIISLSIENHSDQELPFTGGHGVRLLSIIGLVLMVGAAVLFFMIRKRTDRKKGVKAVSDLPFARNQNGHANP